MDGFVLETRSIAFGKLNGHKRAQNEESDDTDINVEAFSFWVTHKVYFSIINDSTSILYCGRMLENSLIIEWRSVQ